MYDLLEREITFTASRSGGSGGQNVNKVSSAAQLRWDVNASKAFDARQKTRILAKLKNRINTEGVFYLRSDEQRDLEQNKRRCLEKFYELIAEALYQAPYRRPTKPTRASKERKLSSKKRSGDNKKLRKKIDW